jgi:ABC-type glycerol-3-phosphate transport system substrate-binding protein
MRTSSGRIRWVVLLSVFALLVGACGPAATSSPGGSVAPPASGSAAPSAEGSAATGEACGSGATEVKFWTSHTPPDSDVLQKIVDAFNAANPDICVKMTIVPGAETDVAKLITAIRGGAAPDVYMADRYTLPQRAA